MNPDVPIDRSRKSPEQLRQFARKMRDGASIREAMISSGFSPKQAAKGKRAISQRMLKAMAAEGYKLAEFARQFTMKDLGDMAVGRIAMNTLTGSDKGFNSAKTLGSHRDLNLWTAESQVGVIVLNAPNALSPDAAKLLEKPADLIENE